MIVIDASIALSWILLDEIDDFAKQSADEVIHENAIVPPIFATEVSNALVVAHRRGRIERGTVTDGLLDLAELPIVIESARLGLDEEVDLAVKHGLSVYDSMYLALARRQRVTLLTRDKKLADAATRERVAVKYVAPAGR